MDWRGPGCSAYPLDPWSPTLNPHLYLPASSSLVPAAYLPSTSSFLPPTTSTASSAYPFDDEFSLGAKIPTGRDGSQGLNLEP